MLRTALIKASESAALRRQVERRRLTRRVALRYIAGETLDDGLATTHALVRRGRSVTLDYLGEHVTDEAEARAAVAVIREALERVGTAGLPCGVSVKPSQLGLVFAPALCRELVGEIAGFAAALDVDDPGPGGPGVQTPGGPGGPGVQTPGGPGGPGVQPPGRGAHVTLDMEASDVTEATVALVEDLWRAGHRNVGCALQSYLHRTRDDVKRLSRLDGSLGASLRLCKGAYAEPAAVAYQRRSAVDASYADCADWLLVHGTYPRFATHDDGLVDHVRNTSAREGIGRDAFEFQMLYGVRPSMQDALVRDGYRLRVYVPFGSQWYPYFMRRLAERPANVVFFLRSLRDT